MHYYFSVITGMPTCRSLIVARALSCGQTILFSATRFFQGLVLRKDIYSLDADSHSEYKLRPRVLNLFHLVGIGLGGTIGKISAIVHLSYRRSNVLSLYLGTGIFFFTGHAAGLYAGPSVIISYILAGIVALLAAFSYSEMASIMITPGSAYTYTYVGQFSLSQFLSP